MKISLAELLSAPGTTAMGPSVKPPPTTAPTAPMPAPVAPPRVPERLATTSDFSDGDSFALDANMSGARTVEEMCARAGLTWNVAVENFRTESGAMGGDLRAIVRQDTGLVMAVRSKNFHVMQNPELFKPLQPLVDAGATFRGAGSFREGRTVWAQVRLGEFNVVPGDGVEMFAHVRDSRDGNHVWSLQIGSVRIVCANTLLHACQSGEFLSRARHDRKYRATVDDAAKALESLRGSAMEIIREYQRLAAWKFSRDSAKELLEACLPTSLSKDADKARTLAERQRDEVMDVIFRGQTGGYAIDQVLGTGWGALNGVTDWADHVLATSRSATPAAALQRATEGGAAAVKSAAYDWLIEHCPVPVARA